MISSVKRDTFINFFLHNMDMPFTGSATHLPPPPHLPWLELPVHIEYKWGK